MGGQEITLKVDGMTCSNCALGIEKALKDKGFVNAAASFMDGEVVIHTGQETNLRDAIKQIESLGYSVHDIDNGTKKGPSAVEKKFLFAVVFTIPLFAHMLLPHTSLLGNAWFQLVMCLPVYIVGVQYFGKSAVGSLKAGVANMDVLIFTGSTAAFVYSISGIALYYGTEEVQQYLFFETTAMIITLVLLGNVIEHRSVQQASGYLRALMALEPRIARIVLKVGSREKVMETTPDVLRPGDLIQVNEGDRIPADAILVHGEALLDESAITGESEAVTKKKGDSIYSGTVLISGSLRAEVTAFSKHSTLQRIADLVKKARRDQPEIQRLGDRVSAVFVPVVLVIALATFALNYTWADAGLTASLLHTVAVLVIACPCAMGLATPTAVAAGLGRAAKDGIIFKGGSTVESLAGTDMVVFDKTGTLTTGRFTARFATNSAGARAKAIIKGIEAHSSHPLANSLTAMWPDVLPETFTEVLEVKGKGMSGVLKTGESVWFGKAAADISDADLMLLLNDSMVATLCVEDELKSGAADAVAALKKSGLRVVVLSGDKPSKVKSTAKALGIEEYHAGVSPAGKLELLEKWAAENRVAMVGDGINDGPALSRAHTGIAPGSATALAQESAKVVIMHPDEMDALVKVFATARLTYATIRQNLFWAFFYNVVAIPIAAAGMLNPMIAALAMALSDVIVVGNSVRLKYSRLR